MVTPPQLKTALLLIAPALITWWCVADGGLRNNLNRLGYEIFVGLFFAGYGLLQGLAEVINRVLKRRNPHNLRLMGYSFAALLVWIVGCVAFENLRKIW